MKAKWLIMLALLALPALTLAQRNMREPGRAIADQGEGSTATYQIPAPATSGSNAAPVLIGRMWNAYSPQSPYTNLIYYDPFTNRVAMVHRNDRTGPGSGYIVYQISDDQGATWSQQIGPINAPGFVLGRHPNLLITNPAQSNDPLATSVVVTYNDLTTFGGFGDVFYVTDKYAGRPIFFGRDSLDAFSYAGAVDLNNGDCYFSIISATTEFFAVSKVSAGGTVLLPRVLLAPIDHIILGSGTAIDVGNDGTVHWVGRAIWTRSAGAPDEQNFYWRYQRSTDGGKTWSTPEYVGPQVVGLDDSNYEFDIIVDANNEVHIAGLLVDNVTPTESRVALYDLVRSTSGTWSGTKVADIRQPVYNAIPQDPGGGLLQQLNEPEYAKTKDGTALALKWIDIIENTMTPADSLNPDVWISSRSIDETWSTPENVSQSPTIAEAFSNLAPLMSDDGQLFMYYVTPTVPGTGDLSEHDIWFLPEAKASIARVSLTIPDTLTAPIGHIVDIPILLTRNGKSLAALGAAIKVTNKMLSFTGFTPGPIVPGASFSVHAPAPDSVRVAFTDFGGGPISRDGVLVTLHFRVDPDAVAGDISALNFSELSAADPDFASLPLRGIPGKITFILLPVTVAVSDTLVGEPGDTVAVTVMLDRGRHDIASLGAAIKATNGILTFSKFTSGPIIPGTVFNVSSPAPDSVRLAFVNFGGGPITQDGLLVTLFFRIDPEAKDSSFAALNLSELSATDHKLRDLPVQSRIGKVTVVVVPGEIHGTKFEDSNGNGIRDAEEPGLSGWTILLDGAKTDTTVTDASGLYRFTDLEPGTYRVSEVLQEGWMQTYPEPPGYWSLTIRSSTVHDSIDFGDFELGEIHGMKFNDLNGNGVKNAGEPGLQGWKIQCQPPDEVPPIYDYFPSRASVTLQIPAISQDSIKLQLSGPTLIRRGTPHVDTVTQKLTIATEIVSLQLQSETPFGPLKIRTRSDQRSFGKIEGPDQAQQFPANSFFDVFVEIATPVGSFFHREPIRLAAEINQIPPTGTTYVNPSAQVVPLFDSAGTLVGQLISETHTVDPPEPWPSAVTDSLGKYWLMDLPPGIFTLTEAQQEGWEQTTPNPSPIAIASGTKVFDIDFGNWMPGGIHGMKWSDRDSNGVKDPGEEGVRDWTIWLKGVLEDSTVVTDTTATDSLGNYWFMNLKPGRYTVGEEHKTGWRQTYPAAGTHEVVLAAGMVIDTLHFGNYDTRSSVGYERGSRLPETFVLMQNYPNPFNPVTTIKYGIPHKSRVKIEVFNMLGKRVAILRDEIHQPGYYEVKFNSPGLSSGIYLYKLTAPGFVATRKMLQVK